MQEIGKENVNKQFVTVPNVDLQKLGLEMTDVLIYAYLKKHYNNITKDREMCKAIFEESEFFKTKDAKHKQKWYYQDCRYFYWIYKQLN